MPDLNSLVGGIKNSPNINKPKRWTVRVGRGKVCLEERIL